jgi:WD40 repeat protein
VISSKVIIPHADRLTAQLSRTCIALSALLAACTISLASTAQAETIDVALYGDPGKIPGVAWSTKPDRSGGREGQRNKPALWRVTIGDQRFELQAAKAKIWRLHDQITRIDLYPNANLIPHTQGVKTIDKVIKAWGVTPEGRLKKAIDTARAGKKLGWINGKQRVDKAIVEVDFNWLGKRKNLWDLRFTLKGSARTATPKPNSKSAAGDTLVLRTSGAKTIAYSPDGSLLALGWKRSIELWNPTARKITRTISTKKIKKSGSIASLAFTPDGKRIVAMAGSQLVLLDVASGSLISQGNLKDLNLGIFSRRIVGVTAGKTALIVGSRRMVEWSLEKQKLLRDLAPVGKKKGFSAKMIVMSPDRKQVAIASAGTEDPFLVDIASWKSVRHLLADRKSRRGSPIGGGTLSFSPDGKRLYRAASGGAYYMWSLPDGKYLGFVNMQSCQHIAVSPDNKWLAIGTGNPAGTNHLMIAKPGESKPRYTLGPFSRSTGNVYWSPDGKTIAVLGSGQAILFNAQKLTK